MKSQGNPFSQPTTAQTNPFESDSSLNKTLGPGNGRGNITLDFDHLDPKARASLLKAYSILSEEEIESEEEEKDIKEFEDILRRHPNYENMSPEQLMDVLDLKPETKRALQAELDEMVNQAEASLAEIDIRSLFPDSESSASELMKSIQAVIARDPSLQKEVDEWMKQVRGRVGDDMRLMEALSDEEFVTIATPPPRLRSALKEVMSSDLPMLESSGDVVQFFSNKKESSVCYWAKHRKITEMASELSMQIS